MAIMYITEYAAIAPSNEKNNNPSSLQIPQEPALAVQVITFGATTASAALDARTKFVSIQLDTVGHIQFAASPTATTTSSHKHAADVVTWHGVNSSLKVAAVTA